VFQKGLTAKNLNNQPKAEHPHGKINQRKLKDPGDKIP
jgi:hypothetical protein